MWKVTYEEFEDANGVIRIHNSKDRQHSGQQKGQTTQWPKERTTDSTVAKRKDRQHSGQRKEGHKKNNDLQNITHKTKDRVTRTSLKTRGELSPKLGAL